MGYHLGNEGIGKNGKHAERTKSAPSPMGLGALYMATGIERLERKRQLYGIICRGMLCDP